MANERIDRNNGSLVKLNERKQLTQEARAVACLYATYLTGWQSTQTKSRKLLIAEAACNIICYDCGYKKNVGKHGLDQWLKRISNSVAKSSTTAITNNKHTGKISYLDQITRQYPTYLHELYRSACQLVGDNATFDELARTMNMQSTAYQNLPNLRIHKLQLFRWLKKKERQGKQGYYQYFQRHKNKTEFNMHNEY